MSPCLPWHHPLWKRASKLSAASKIGLVQAVFAALRDDPVLAPLGLKDKVAVLSDGFGESTTRIAMIIAALQQLGLLNETATVDADSVGRLRTAADGERTAARSEIVLPSEFKTQDDFKTRLKTLQTPDDGRCRALRAARNRRYYLNRKANFAGAANNPPSCPPSEFKTAPLEERDDLFSLSETVARASKQEPERVTKRRRLYKRAMDAAPLILDERQHSYLLEQMTAVRFERFLDRGTGVLPAKLKSLLETLFERTRWRGEPEVRPPDRPVTQRHLPLPINGGRAAAPVSASVSAYEREAALQSISDPALRAALNGLRQVSEAQRKRRAG